MDYRNAFAVSASGMAVEKLRLDVTAANLANMNSTKAIDGKLYQPLQLVSGPATGAFGNGFEQLRQLPLQGVTVRSVLPVEAPPRMVYEPGHPDADAKGYVTLPGVNHMTEMVNLSRALRAYQANVVAFNASKTMAHKALELGGGQ